MIFVDSCLLMKKILSIKLSFFRRGKGSDGPLTRTVGLWRACLRIDEEGHGSSECGDTINAPADFYDKMMAARVFVTICCILSSLSVVSILLILFVEENLKKLVSILAQALAFASLVGGIIGVALGMAFAMKTVGSKADNIGVSSILGIIAIVFNLAGAITTFIIK